VIACAPVWEVVLGIAVVGLLEVLDDVGEACAID
jgi:hypothetical protein